jgi:hypothetical protein
MLNKSYADRLTVKKAGRIIAFIIVLTLLITLSCTFTGTQDTSLQATKVALEAQMTIMAQQDGQNTQLTAAAEQANQVAQNSQATLMAQQITQLTQQAAQLAEGQPQESQITEEPVQATEPPPAATENPANDAELEAKIKAAKILLFEDISGQKVGSIYPDRYVKSALDAEGYAYTDVGSAMGWLKEQLLSSTDWDLIIIASEYKTRISGEYFDYLLQHINRGTGVIIELWYLDQISAGTISKITSKCGIEEYRDWTGSNELALWPLIPDHPLFQEPNHNISLRGYTNFWPDHGDLVRLTGSGDAQLLLGTIATDKTNHGVLTSCLDGRLLIQTFLDHDYERQNIEAYWMNAIHYVLKQHFLTSP